MKRLWHFWAVDMAYESGDRFLAGVGIFGWPRPETPGIDGPGTALFRSRQTARAAIKVKGLERYRAKAVRVVCIVKVLP